MSDLPAIITAVVGGLVPLGGGIAFIWSKVEKRFAKVEEALEECKRREELGKRTGAVNLTVITLLCQEVTRLSPGKPNPALRRAHTLLTALHAAMPVDEAIPPDLQALIEQLDEDLAG